MKDHVARSAGTIAGAALLFAASSATAATIAAGSGSNPRTTATGIHEIVIVKTDSGLKQQALALVHKGALREVHSRSATGYQRRIGGSSDIRVSPSKYGDLLTLAGDLNRSVNGQSLTTRCKFYSLAGIPMSGMGCPAPLSLPRPEPPFANQVCPDGYDLEFSTVNGTAVIQCVRPTTTTNLLPAVPGRSARPSCSLHHCPIAPWTGLVTAMSATVNPAVGPETAAPTAPGGPVPTSPPVMTR